MVDAQGNTIAHQGSTRATIEVYDVNDEPVVFKENFVLGKVKHPILCLGELLKRGWEVSDLGEHGGLCLNNERKEVSVPTQMRRHSLQMEARIHMIREDESSPTSPMSLASIGEIVDDEMRVMVL